MKIRMKLTLLAVLIVLALLVMPGFAADEKAGCVDDSKGPITSEKRAVSADKGNAAPSQPAPATAMVGEIAPDFEASAYYQGGFKNIKLSDFRGKWVLLCFYPGDFTFV